MGTKKRTFGQQKRRITKQYASTQQSLHFDWHKLASQQKYIIISLFGAVIAYAVFVYFNNLADRYAESTCNESEYGHQTASECLARLAIRTKCHKESNSAEQHLGEHNFFGKLKELFNITDDLTRNAIDARHPDCPHLPDPTATLGIIQYIFTIIGGARSKTNYNSAHNCISKSLLEFILCHQGAYRAITLPVDCKKASKCISNLSHILKLTDQAIDAKINQALLATNNYHWHRNITCAFTIVATIVVLSMTTNRKHSIENYTRQQPTTNKGKKKRVRKKIHNTRALTPEVGAESIQPSEDRQQNARPDVAEPYEDLGLNKAIQKYLEQLKIYGSLFPIQREILGILEESFITQKDSKAINACLRKPPLTRKATEQEIETHNDNLNKLASTAAQGNPIRLSLASCYLSPHFLRRPLTAKIVGALGLDNDKALKMLVQSKIIFIFAYGNNIGLHLYKGEALPSGIYADDDVMIFYLEGASTLENQKKLTITKIKKLFDKYHNQSTTLSPRSKARERVAISAALSLKIQGDKMDITLIEIPIAYKGEEIEFIARFMQDRTSINDNAYPNTAIAIEYSLNQNRLMITSSHESFGQLMHSGKVELNNNVTSLLYYVKESRSDKLHEVEPALASLLKLYFKAKALNLDISGDLEQSLIEVYSSGLCSLSGGHIRRLAALASSFPTIRSTPLGGIVTHGTEFFAENVRQHSDRHKSTSSPGLSHL